MRRHANLAPPPAAAPESPNWLVRALGGTLSTGAAVVFTGLLGVYGDRHQDEILDAFDTFPRGEVAVHAVVFYVFSGLLAVLAIASVAGAAFDRRRAQARRDAENAEQRALLSRLDSTTGRLEQADAERREALKTLHTLLQTLPDARFMSSFQDVYEQVSGIVEVTLAGTVGGRVDLQPPTASDLKLAARGVLNGIATLAQAFDAWEPITPGAAHGDLRAAIVYAANVMIYRPVEDVTPEEARTLIDQTCDGDPMCGRLRNVDPETNFFALAGILDLRCDISSSTDGERSVPDSGLKPLALPIPREHSNADNFSRLQPGAPDAFVHKKVQVYASGEQMIAALKNRDLSPTVKKRIKEHFRERPELRVRSLISLPLLHPGSERPLGVLNVHRNRPGMLRDKNPEQYFTPLITPLVLNLSQLVYRLLRLEGVPLSESDLRAETPDRADSLAGAEPGSDAGASSSSEGDGAPDPADTALPRDLSQGTLTSVAGTGHPPATTP